MDLHYDWRMTESDKDPYPGDNASEMIGIKKARVFLGLSTQYLYK